jgi:hypothetical protein
MDVIAPRHFQLTMGASSEVFSRAPGWEEGEKSRRMRKNAPKTPNPFMLFCQQRRTQLHILNPSLASREITQRLADEWRQMPEAEKQSYAVRSRQLFREQQGQTTEARDRAKERKRIILQIPSQGGHLVSISAFIEE